MEQELYSFPLSTTAFKSAISFTARHFGIDTGYFLNEIERLSSWPNSIDCDSPYEAALESEEDLQLFIPFNPQCLIDIFKQLDSTKSDIDFFNAMLLVTILVYPNGSGDRIVNSLYNEWQETLEEYVKYDAVRAEMLKLYLLLNSAECNEESVFSIRVKDSAYGSVSIFNHFNWFSKELIQSYLDKYLTGISSIEEAKSALALYKGKQGNTYKAYNASVIAYGIYSLYQELRISDVKFPNELAFAIIEYLSFADMTGEDWNENMDPDWIRAKVYNMRSHPIKFPEAGLPKKVNTNYISHNLISSGTKKF